MKSVSIIGKIMGISKRIMLNFTSIMPSPLIQIRKGYIEACVYYVTTYSLTHSQTAVIVKHGENLSQNFTIASPVYCFNAM